MPTPEAHIVPIHTLCSSLLRANLPSANSSLVPDAHLQRGLETSVISLLPLCVLFVIPGSFLPRIHELKFLPFKVLKE